MQQMPSMVPYGFPMQQMPTMPYGGYPMMFPMQQPMPFQPAPVPEAAPTPTTEAAPAAAPAAAEPAQAVAPAPTPVAVPEPVAVPAPVAAPTPAPVPVSPYPTNTQFNPFGMMMGMGMGGMGQPGGPKRPYEMRRVIPQSEKTQMMQMALPMMTGMMRMEMPDSMNYFARKYQAQPGLSFDEVRDSLFLRANQLNMKKVGENLMWKDFQVVLNDMEAPRIEVYSFCDIEVGRDLLKISPEFIVFLPCRIAVMEDADKNIWVLMVDWNMDWIAGYEQKLGMTPELLKGARSINERMDEMMRAAANGDL
jgi:uncharacterized protein (DUF302 family)